MLETLKKQWFVVLIACLLLSTVAYFTYDQNKGKLPGKTAGGKDVVFVINGKNITSDDLYDQLYKTTGIASIYSAFERSVIQQAFSGDKDVLSAIKLKADDLTTNTTAQYKQYYPDTYEAEIAKALRANGYEGFSDLNLYFTNALKIENMVKVYLNANMNTYFTAFKAAVRPRIVSYVVIAMDNPAKPTEEEAKRLKTAQDAWATKTYTFADFAKKFSEDSAASTGGYLGYFDINSSSENGGSYDNAFSSEALKLDDGKISGWIKSSFGWHLITVKTDLESLKVEDAFYNALANYDIAKTHIRSNVVWEAATKVGLDFNGDAALEAALKKYMHLDAAK
jgi:foldase protein PrsA